MPTHWGLSGGPDGYGSRAEAVFRVPLILLASHLFCAAVVSKDPKGKNISNKIFRIVLWFCPAVSIFTAFLVYGTVFSLEIDSDKITLIFIGVMFVVLGNYFPKIRQNRTVGIRLPWTLHDEENWNQTHRITGRVWMVGGILLMIGVILGIEGNQGSIIMCSILVFVALFPIGYSFVYYLKHRN